MQKLEQHNRPLVSIITVNFNQPEVTLELLESLKSISYPHVEIIVVENGSSHTKADEMRQRFPGVKLIISEQNLGFAGGNNLGIRASSGEYIMLLNNDTEVDPHFLEPLVQKCMDDRSLGAVSPKIYFAHSPGLLQFAGFSEMDMIRVRNHGWGYAKEDTGQFDQDRESYFAHGAAMMVPRSVIEKVGLMAEIFFLYYEEMDWALRIRRAGYRIMYVHNARIYHKESVSTGRDSPLKTYYMNRARILFLRRNTSGLTRFLAFMYQYFLSFPKNAVVFLYRQRLDLLKAYLRAQIWHIRHLNPKDLTQNPFLHER